MKARDPREFWHFRRNCSGKRQLCIPMTEGPRRQRDASCDLTYAFENTSVQFAVRRLPLFMGRRETHVEHILGSDIGIENAERRNRCFFKIEKDAGPPTEALFAIISDSGKLSVRGCMGSRCCPETHLVSAETLPSTPRGQGIAYCL
jgi:hypothetical protein